MRIIVLTFLAISILSCKQSDGLVMEAKSTIPILETDSPEELISKASHVVPTSAQYEALKNEFIAFIHFGPNAFTQMEWGTGKEDPMIFDLHNLDTDQWCQAMKSAEMKMVIITAKHHDGFCLWQSRYTSHGVMSSPYKEGKGDIMKELAASCRKYGLKLGFYLSPADLYQMESSEGLYGNLSTYSERTIPRPVVGRPFDNKLTFQANVDDYNEYFMNQLFELLTEYGPIDEVWFDGAHPKKKGGQKYNYLAWKELITALAPNAVVFGKEDIRWCGNESGNTRSTEWNVIPYQEDPAMLNNFADLTEQDIGSIEKMKEGKFLHYQQAETNTSIREGWFYRNEEEQNVRTPDDVFDMYERSVGGNSTYLLNIPPNREGRFSDPDVAALKEVGRRIKNTYDINLISKASGPKETIDNDPSSYVLLTGDEKVITLEFEEVKMNRVVVQEAILSHGERIEKMKVEAWKDKAWKLIGEVTNVGYKRIIRFPNISTSKLRITVLESRAEPAISSVSAHFYSEKPSELIINKEASGLISIGSLNPEFTWKPHRENILKNLYPGIEIRYTMDGSEPTSASTLYEKPFASVNKTIKAAAFLDGVKFPSSEFE